METAEIYDTQGKIIPRQLDGMDALDFLNAAIWSTEIRDFCVADCDGSTLLITGSFDQCYYHEIEVRFIEVEHMSISTRFTDPKFAIVPVNGEFRAPSGVELDESLKCFRIQDPNEFYDYDFLIVAEGITVRTGLVYHEASNQNGTEQGGGGQAATRSEST